jgi:integrase
LALDFQVLAARGYLRDEDAIERQLAHQEANEIRGAYAHAAEFWQERVRMMQWWADEFDRLREHGRVIKMSA